MPWSVQIGPTGWVARYPRGFTIRGFGRCLIVRWGGYVPAELKGLRFRFGKIEGHWRKLR